MALPYYPHQAQRALRRQEFTENNIVNELVVYCLARLKFAVTRQHRDYIVYSIPTSMATKPRYDTARVKRKLMDVLTNMQWGVAHVGSESGPTLLIYVKTIQQTQSRLELQS